MVLVGPSGCGKSTALRMVAGLEDDHRRRGHRRARRQRRSPPKDRDIAMVFQSYALYPHMTVAENIGLRAQAAQVAEARDRPARSTRRPHRSSSTSSSTASRGSSPAASASGSPWAGRSSASRRRSSWTSRCRTSTRSCACRCAPRSSALQQRLGTTTIYVTHDQVEAMTMGDRVAVLRDGVLQQVDTPQELYDDAGEPVRRRLHRLTADELRRRHARARRDGALTAEFGSRKNNPLARRQGPDEADRPRPQGLRGSAGRARHAARGPRRTRTLRVRRAGRPPDEGTDR